MIDCNFPKAELRRTALKERVSIPENEIRIMNETLENNLVDFLSHVYFDKIFTFFSIKNEPDINPALYRNFSGKTICFPRCNTKDKSMDFSAVKDISFLTSGAYSIPEPPATPETVIPLFNDIIFIPGVLFDRQGYRIGYGAGYYDRFLSGVSPVKIGICFDRFIVDELPHNSTDIQVDYIISENEIISISGQGAKQE